MRKQKKQQKTGSFTGMRGILLGLCLAAGLCAAAAFVNAADDRKLQNGSFEDVPAFTGDYSQPIHENVPDWNTTAYNTTGKNGKIELFKSNTNTYIKGVTLTPSHGTIAAELNADEESTLYQNVKTAPSSVYEWGLDHGGRTYMDTMALVIGPKQSKDPSKPSKAGRDQLMQMVDWLIEQGKTSVKSTQGLGEKLIVYSKKFSETEYGAFEDNKGNDAFSLTPSTLHTEEWHIWIMADGKASSGPNPWGHYGSNAEEAADSNTENQSNEKSVDLSKYYLYTVPAGQTDTLFAFVSVGCYQSKEKTFGNFLDNINFRLYHPLSGSSTTHGSAVIGGSDGTAEGEGASEGHNITVDNKLATYVTDGQSLMVQAIVKKADADAKCEFVGLYYTVQDGKGNPDTKFLRLAGNEIEDTGNLTEEEKQYKWIKSTNDNGDIIYTSYLPNLTSATDLHFVFIKSPTVTYDSNGGKPYVVERTYNTDEKPNVYSFKPAAGVADTEAGTTSTFISPYVSKAAEGQNDGWKFMGWKLTGDTVTIPEGVNVDKVNADQLGELLLPAVHTVACNYSMAGATGETAAQYFKFFYGNVTLNKEIQRDNNEKNGEIIGVLWADNKEERVYANVHKGLTMVAQWRWRQAFIPQMKSGDNYTDSNTCGTVEITSVTDTSDNNYNAVYNEKGGKSYHAETDETITVEAKPKTGFTFEGWYDASGNLVTTNTVYSYTETSESVNTYYARFSGSVTQIYIRQVKNGDSWDNVTDDKIGTLSREEFTDAPGKQISSVATAGTGYKFLGWYDADGNKVSGDMLNKNDPTIISYETTVDATYYARFAKTYTVYFKAQTKQADGSFKTENVGGQVSVSSAADVEGATVTSNASANSGAKFLGWYDASGNQLSTNAAYSPKITTTNNGVTYYARFEFVHNPQINEGPLLSFIAESENVQIPSAFDGRNAGTGKNAAGYGLDNKFGNTIATGFKYSIGNMTNVSTIQITVTVPNSAYVKVGGTGGFTGNGASILTDSEDVKYNRGSIQQISGATTLTYYWDASGITAGTTYGFIIDNLYAPGATATITVNGTSGTRVTNENGVVNTSSGAYRGSSHYAK